jgi:hypothetical protein
VSPGILLSPAAGGPKRGIRCSCPQPRAAARWVADHFPIRTVSPPRQLGCQVSANHADAVANTPPLHRFRSKYSANHPGESVRRVMTTHPTSVNADSADGEDAALSTCSRRRRYRALVSCDDPDVYPPPRRLAHRDSSVRAGYAAGWGIEVPTPNALDGLGNPFRPTAALSPTHLEGLGRPGSVRDQLGERG